MSVFLYAAVPFVDSRTNNTGIVADMRPEASYEKYTPPFAVAPVGYLLYRVDPGMMQETQQTTVIPVYLQDMHFNQINQVRQAEFRDVDLGLKVPEVGV